MDWSSIAQGVISGIGSAVGGALGESASKEASKDAYKRNLKTIRQTIPLMVEGAVEAGLHPLAAIGVNPASGPPPAVVGDLGRGVADMGANIGRAAEALLRPEDKAAAHAMLLDLETRQVNLDIAKAQLAGAHKALLTQGSTPGIASNIPASGPVLSGKGNKLGGASVYGRTDLGQAFWVPPGWTAEQWEQEFGELMSEVQGVSRAARSTSVQPSAGYSRRGGGLPWAPWY